MNARFVARPGTHTDGQPGALLYGVMHAGCAQNPLNRPDMTLCPGRNDPDLRGAQ